MSLIPELEDYARQLDSANAEAAALVAAYTEEQLMARPAPGRWSAAECLAHVALTVQVYLPAFDDAIAEGRAKGLRSEGPFQYGMLSRIFIWLISPPMTQRFKAPAAFLPGTPPTPEVALAEFVDRHVDLLARLDLANGLDLKSIKLVSPANERLKLPLGAAFAVLVAHARRHLWQARRALGECT